MDDKRSDHSRSQRREIVNHTAQCRDLVNARVATGHLQSGRAAGTSRLLCGCTDALLRYGVRNSTDLQQLVMTPWKQANGGGVTACHMGSWLPASQRPGPEACEDLANSCAKFQSVVAQAARPMFIIFDWGGSLAVQHGIGPTPKVNSSQFWRSPICYSQPAWRSSQFNVTVQTTRCRNSLVICVTCA